MNKLGILKHVRLGLCTKHCASPLPVPRTFHKYRTGILTEPTYIHSQFRFNAKDSIHQRHMSVPSPSRPMASFFDKIRNKWHIKLSKYKLAHFGSQLYERTVDNLDYDQFYKEFNMADTFFSWFLVTELHVWMLMCRIMAEGKDGKIVRHNIVDSMWQDVTTRAGLLGEINSSVKKKQLRDLSQQFYAAITEYDEGIMSDDKALAGALWRIFFNLECNNPQHLEKLIIYVRKQMNALDGLSYKELWSMSHIKWLDIKCNT